MHIKAVLIVFFTSCVLKVFPFGFTASSNLARLFHKDVSMKIFDWKRREEWAKNPELPEDYKLHVTTIFSNPGSRKKSTRVGRGIAAGKGKSAGRGMRGQKSRKGEGKGVRAGFEGGQTPLYRRIPKIHRPMKGHTKTVYNIIKIEALNKLNDGETVDATELRERKLISKPNKGRKLYKVLGGDELATKGLIVRAHAFTESARAMIEGNGGQCVLMSPTRNITLEEAIAAKAELAAQQLARWRERNGIKQKV